MLTISRAPFRYRSLAAMAMAGQLAACGGGESSTPTPPKNSAPQFSSGTAASVVENWTGAVYHASATDADADNLMFSIQGGPDAAAFTLSGTALSFVIAPNFDRFADADKDNVYSVTLQVSDGRGGAADRTVDVAVTNDREGVSVRRLVSGLVDPVGISGFLDDEFIMVGERDGTIWSINVQDGSRTVFRELNLAPGRDLLDVAAFGIGGVVQAPAALVRDSNGIYLLPGLFGTPVNEIKIADGDPRGAIGTISYTWGSSLGGQGLMVVAVGDPGGQRAQGSSGYGKLYVVRDPNFQTTLNDFFLIGRGLQQPTRIFDFESDVLIADAGQTVGHELNRVSSRNPVNFGWPFFEGGTAIASGAPASLTAPVFTLPFGEGPLRGTLIRGGVWFDSSDPFQRSSVKSLQDGIVFGDANGSIFTVNLDFEPNSLENRSQDFIPNTGTIDSIVGMAEDGARVLYILDADGEVFVVEQR